MQKKIILLAIASAMTVPALAFADVSVSGQINMSVDMSKTGVAGADASTNSLTSNQSRLIFSGSEDVGNGLAAIFQLDARFTADDGNNATTTYPTYSGGVAKFYGGLFNGNTYLGVKSSSMGTLKFGIMDTPFKSATRDLDVFYDVAGDYRKGIGSIGGLLSGHDLRLPNTLAYTSPSMSGFTAAIGTVFGAETASSIAAKGSAYSLAGMYSQGPIYATLAYETLKAGTNGSGTLAAGGNDSPFVAGAVGDESKSLRLGGGYTMDAITVNAMFEQPKYTTAVGGIERKNTNWYFGGKFAVSSTDSVRAAITLRGETKLNDIGQNDKGNQISIGYAHDMSKATSVYATYVKTSQDGATAAASADPSSLSIGMKHSF